MWCYSNLLFDATELYDTSRCSAATSLTGSTSGHIEGLVSFRLWAWGRFSEARDVVNAQADALGVARRINVSRTRLKAGDQHRPPYNASLVLAFSFPLANASDLLSPLPRGRNLGENSNRFRLLQTRSLDALIGLNHGLKWCAVVEAAGIEPASAGRFLRNIPYFAEKCLGGLII